MVEPAPRQLSLSSIFHASTSFPHRDSGGPKSHLFLSRYMYVDTTLRRRGENSYVSVRARKFLGLQTLLRRTGLRPGCTIVENMGNAGSTSGSTITLSDGTFVGGASETGAAFAKAIQRMHCIFKDCDSEFCDLSDAVNTHGKQSEAFKLAAQRLQACQRRRERQLASIEGACGPAQDGYRLCVQHIKASGQGHEHDCLPVLHDFLDCAERTLARGGERST